MDTLTNQNRMTTLKEIVLSLCPIEFIGNENQIINEIIQLNSENKRDDVLTWCSDKNISKLVNCERGTIICSVSLKQQNLSNSTCNYIIVDNPRQAFSDVLTRFFAPKSKEMVISEFARIHNNAKIGKNVFIGDGTIIEENVEIGDNCFIGYNNTILNGTIIHNNVKIGSNNTIGGIGFGYEKNSNGDYIVIPHIGNVVIKQNVEIGNNTCIDRAVLGSTLLEENVKVDNLVHIAHGVRIGRNSLIIANSMIGGSSTIGENVWVAPSASIINKVDIGDDSLVGMGAVVLKPVVKSDIVAGNPAKSLRK